MTMYTFLVTTITISYKRIQNLTLVISTVIVWLLCGAYKEDERCNWKSVG